MNQLYPEFRKVKFGYASAEKESQADPTLLIEGYFDETGLIDEICSGDKFLVLGYKGSGKSAIAQHLVLKSNSKSDLFITSLSLADFSFVDFDKIITGAAGPEGRYPIAWSWLLMLSMIDSFSCDVGAATYYDKEFHLAVDILTKAGLLPGADLNRVALYSSKQTFKLDLLKFLELGFERTAADQTLQIPMFVDRLKMIANRFRSKSRHLLIIDGLDDVLTRGDVQYESLAALIVDTSRLNHMFLTNHVPAKIVLLCRTDLFERLPGANKNKIRQDSAIELDWYHNPKDPNQSRLIKLVNHRARLVYPELDDLFNRFFPRYIYQDDAKYYIIDYTRHTPRDIIQSLIYIQRAMPMNRSYLTSDDIHSGLINYSLNYFYPEIIDELGGYISTEDIHALLQLLAMPKSRQFYLNDLEYYKTEVGLSVDCDLIPWLNLLFNCSAIGNAIRKENGLLYHTSKYRNKHSRFNPDQLITLHKGLWRAMNA